MKFLICLCLFNFISAMLNQDYSSIEKKYIKNDGELNVEALDNISIRERMALESYLVM